MRLYVAGPMTGLPEWNYPAFRTAEQQLRDAGYGVESPHHNNDGEPHDWQWYMRAGIRQLLKCDGVALLPGWEKSKGATLERVVAATLGMQLGTVEDWLQIGHAGRVPA